MSVTPVHAGFANTISLTRRLSSLLVLEPGVDRIGPEAQGPAEPKAGDLAGAGERVDPLRPQTAEAHDALYVDLRPV
jgi:hypothetical protein